MFLHFGLYFLIVLITEQLTRFVICEFIATFEELNCCEPPIKIGWFCSESTSCVRCVENLEDVKECIESALKKSIGVGPKQSKPV